MFRKNLRHLCVRQGEKNNITLLDYPVQLTDRQAVPASEAAPFAAAAQSDNNIKSAITQV